MLRPDADLTQGPCLRRGLLEDDARVGTEPLHGDARTAEPVLLCDDAAQRVPLQPLRAQDARAQPLRLGRDAEQQMLRPDIGVAQLSRRGPCVLDRQLRALGEFLVALDAEDLPPDTVYYPPPSVPKRAKADAENGPCRPIRSIAALFTKYRGNSYFCN